RDPGVLVDEPAAQRGPGVLGGACGIERIHTTFTMRGEPKGPLAPWERARVRAASREPVGLCTTSLLAETAYGWLAWKGAMGKPNCLTLFPGALQSPIDSLRGEGCGAKPACGLALTPALSQRA